MCMYDNYNRINHLLLDNNIIIQPPILGEVGAITLLLMPARNDVDISIITIKVQYSSFINSTGQMKELVLLTNYPELLILRGRGNILA